MSDPMPTFHSGRDRLTYLLAEFKIPLTVMAVALLIILAFATPQVPSPPEEAVMFSISALLLAMPAYVAGLKISKYLWPGPDRVTVGVADPGTAGSETELTGEYEKYGVLPEVWNERSEVGSSAMQPAEGVDYVVTRFNWYDELGELEIRGAEQADLEPGEAWVNATRVDTLYEFHQQLKRKYTVLKSNVNDLLTDVHDAAIMREIGEREKADLSPGVTVSDKIEEFEDEIDGLPTGPEKDDRTQQQRDMGMGSAESIEEAMGDLRPDRGATIDGGGSAQQAATDGGESNR